MRERLQNADRKHGRRGSGQDPRPETGPDEVPTTVCGQIQGRTNIFVGTYVDDSIRDFFLFWARN